MSYSKLPKASQHWNSIQGFELIPYETGTFIWTVVGAIMASLAALFSGLAIYFQRRMVTEQKNSALKRSLKVAELFTFEETIPSPLEYPCANSLQRADISLMLMVDTYVHFIAIRFKGNGPPPKITRLDDPQRVGETPFNVAISRIDDGTWYWNYTDGWLRFEDSRITIGVTFDTQGPFEGCLWVKMTAVDGSKDRSLPFVISG